MPPPKSHTHFLVTKTNRILDALGGPGSDEGPEGTNRNVQVQKTLEEMGVLPSFLVWAYNIAEILVSSNSTSTLNLVPALGYSGEG